MEGSGASPLSGARYSCRLSPTELDEVADVEAPSSPRADSAECAAGDAGRLDTGDASSDAKLICTAVCMESDGRAEPARLADRVHRSRKYKVSFQSRALALSHAQRCAPECEHAIPICAVSAAGDGAIPPETADKGLPPPAPALGHLPLETSQMLSPPVTQLLGACTPHFLDVHVCARPWLRLVRGSVPFFAYGFDALTSLVAEPFHYPPPPLLVLLREHRPSQPSAMSAGDPSGHQNQNLSEEGNLEHLVIQAIALVQGKRKRDVEPAWSSVVRLLTTTINAFKPNEDPHRCDKARVWAAIGRETEITSAWFNKLLAEAKTLWGEREQRIVRYNCLRMYMAFVDLRKELLQVKIVAGKQSEALSLVVYLLLSLQAGKAGGDNLNISHSCTVLRSGSFTSL